MQASPNFKLTFHWMWVVPILLLSFALAIPHYSQDAVWFDEAYTHLYSGTGRVPSSSVAESLLLIAKTDPWPPGYYLMTMAWGRLTGRASFTDYVLPTLLGLIALAVIFQLGKQLFGKKYGLLASVLIATSAIFIHYTHENRAYTLYILVIALMALYYWLFITRPNYRRRWLRWGFPLAIGMALYTHFVASAFVLGIILYHLWYEHPSRTLNPHMNLKRWQDGIRLWINGCLLFTPWFAMLLGTLATETSDNRGLPIPTALQYIIYSFSNNFWLIFILLFLASIAFWKMKQVRFLWVWLLASAVVVLGINSVVGFLFHPRHVLPFLLIMLLLILSVLRQLEDRFRGLPILWVGLYAGAGIAFSITPHFMYEIPTHIQPIPLASIHEIQVIAEQCVQENDMLILSVDEAEHDKVQSVALEYYLIGEVENFIPFGRLTTTVDANNEQTLLETSAMREASEEFIAERDTVWLMRLPRVNNMPTIMQFDNMMTQSGYLSCPFRGTNQIDVWFYTTEDTCETVMSACQ